MKRTIILLLIFSGLAINAFSQKATAATTYAGGIFTTSVTKTFSVTQDAANKQIDRFIAEYKTNLPALFAWALKGVNLHGEQDKFMIFNIKSHKLENNIVKGKMDMSVVPLKRHFQDVKYDVSISKTEHSAGEVEISYKLFNCEEVIKQATATMKIKQLSETSAVITLIINVQLEKFYNMLVSKKMYSENMEWRFINFVENIAK